MPELTGRLFDWTIGIVSVLLVGLTLYTAYFGFFLTGCSAAGICFL